MRYLFSWSTVYIYSSIIIIFSVLPIEPPKSLVFPLADKILHGLAYALLSFMVANISYKCKKSAKLFGFFYAFILGLVLEFTQLLLPFRYFESADILANFLGSLLGCLFKVI